MKSLIEADKFYDVTTENGTSKNNRGKMTEGNKIRGTEYPKEKISKLRGRNVQKKT